MDAAERERRGKKDAGEVTEALSTRAIPLRVPANSAQGDFNLKVTT